MDKKVLSVRRYKAGYEIRTEEVSWDGKSKPTISRSAYNTKGDYIGTAKDAYRLVVKRGIMPEKASSEDNVCSIGYSKKRRKWYGWSHRAIYGFGIGYVAKKGSCPTVSGSIDCYLKEHPEADLTVPVGFKVKNLADAKRVAIAMADSVG